MPKNKPPCNECRTRIAELEQERDALIASGCEVMMPGPGSHPAVAHLHNALANLEDPKRELYERGSVSEEGKLMWMLAEQDIMRAIAEVNASQEAGI